MSGKMAAGSVSRREFGKLLGGAGAALLVPGAATGLKTGGPTETELKTGGPAEGDSRAKALLHEQSPAPARPFDFAQGRPDENYWRSVRAQFLLPPDLALMNAANLCPASAAVVNALDAQTRWVDRDPSMPNRRKMTEGREATRRLLAEFLRTTPEEIVITRNTSEGNNIISSGVDLKAGDEVLVFADNHPSLLNAWHEKAKRFGFTVRSVEQVNPHPGADYYVDAFAKQMSARTKVVAFTHVTSTVGDLFPAKELCRLARERGVLSIVDGAQSFGVLDVDLSDMQPDFFTGSAHKWPCGPREVGVLYMRHAIAAVALGTPPSYPIAAAALGTPAPAARPTVWPSIISLYPGAVGASRTFEAMGQRDEAAIIAFGEALKLQTTIGRAAVERRSRELAQALIEGLKKIGGVKIWTHPEPARSAAIVSFQPGTLDGNRLATTLYEKDRIAVMARGGADRGGLRVSPHFYNLHEEIDRTVGAIQRYMRTGT